ncbi:DNA-directed RNA polymerase subunit F [Candidatus Pacearchaeota archaeon CG06_land_8_20_14_3_00_35_12]|nr:MAG: DNA-directed RNA polymerase subunit F [Candidatus Pacearchaeota archaeon CG06_land_8_20_14_3_00_35_12]
MIKSKEPITLAEVRDICKDKEENEKAKQILSYAKQFSKLKTEDALKLKKELQELGIAKLRALHIVKIIDVMPEDADDVRKIFVDDISLNQDEISKILETVKKYNE